MDFSKKNLNEMTQKSRIEESSTFRLNFFSMVLLKENHTDIQQINNYF